MCVNFVVKLLNQFVNFYLEKTSSYKTLSCTHSIINTKKLWKTKNSKKNKYEKPTYPVVTMLKKRKKTV